MEIFKREPRIDFIGRRHVGFIVSALLLVVSIASLAYQGLNLGIDFTGGTVVEVRYERTIELPEVRDALDAEGFGDSAAMHFGTPRDLVVRVPPREAMDSVEISEAVMGALRAHTEGVDELRRVEFVGPQIGRELTEQGLLAMLYALGAILVYVGFRFEYRFAISSVAALVHDVVILLGIFSLMRLNFDLTVLAALLATIGYSLNDTIVILDRIRENFLKIRKGTPAEVMNRSINQTLSRTLVTSFTTLLVVGSLLFVGGELIRGFAIALALGVLVGTYSSIYVAGGVALSLGVSKEDLMPPEKEGADQPREQVSP